MNNTDRVLKVIGDTSIKAGLAGAAMAVGSMVFFGETGNRRVFGISMPSYIPIGAAGVVGSFAGDLAHEFILPHIPQDEKLRRLEAMGLNFLSSGIAFCVSLKAVTGLANQNIPKAIGYGGGAKLATDAVFNQFIDSSRQGFIL
jgi:hypothetical protein